MKKIITLLMIALTLQAQPGEAGIESTKAAKESHWQNWTFFSTLVVTATIGVIVVSLNTGKPAHK